MLDKVNHHADKRSVFITGASTGIGEACALYLDRIGYTVFAGVRKAEDAEALKQKASASLTPVFLDVTHTDEIIAAASQVSEALGEVGLQGLVNNAGIAVAGPLEFLPIEELRQQLEVNVTGVVATTQAFLPLVRKARGRIINMSSLSGSISSPFLGPYHASKFALEALSDALRMELQPWGIEVAVIRPASIKTPIWSKARAAGDELMKRLPPQALEYYGHAVQQLYKRAQSVEHTGADADVVVKAVLHALTAKKPRTRYLVEVNPVMLFFLRLIPDRLRDRIILNQLGLKRKA